MMSTAEYTVVWPLRKNHYLMIEDADMLSTATPVVDETSPSMEIHPASTSPQVASPGRELAARALAAACTQTRIGKLLNISRRTIGRRTADFDLRAALRDDDTLTLALAEVANTETRGSTAEERATAEAWLELARREEQPEPRTNGAAAAKGTPARAPAHASRVSPKRDVSRETQVSIAGQRTVSGKPVNGRATTPPIQQQSPQSRASGLALEQVDALTRHQQRILRRSVVIDCALKAEALDPPTIREAVAELLADITEAARTIGAILQQRQ